VLAGKFFATSIDLGARALVGRAAGKRLANVFT
jgi:hypothetical protein